ncbi:MAG: DUF1289 domain-containing protein [Ferrovibrio sp.]|uniref:DUF1289 domain-containing protein n=1 Tax=Ferrovibrio sp. TaxID=1917215 RepID=UPI003918ADB2
MIDDPPPSPCNKVCSIDRRSGWCLGCFRTGEEIGVWPTLDAAGKHALLERLAERRRQAGAA